MAAEELGGLAGEGVADAGQERGIAAGELRDGVAVEHVSERALQLLRDDGLGEHGVHAGGQAAIAVAG